MFKKKSAKGKNCTKLDCLVLPNSKLKFSSEQLQNLNFLFQQRLLDRQNIVEKPLLVAKSIAERLIQRLICGAGIIDPRFSSKFLIKTCGTSDEENSSSNLSYLFRLDDLSSPNIYELESPARLIITENDTECPPAYCRVRLPTAKMKNWGEFLNPYGYLRRDKVQTRLVTLLAEAASGNSPNSPLQVDESILCGIPGKIMDALTLHHILKVSAHQQMFYGPGGNIPRFPDPRDFRLAIVDEPSGIRIRIEFMSPSLANISLNVKILVAIGVEGWPSTSNFPRRVSLGHSDSLLLHQAAETGMFLVGYGVQSSAWQIRLPVAEIMILNHYNKNSTVKTVRDMLYESVDQIEFDRHLKKHPISYKILNRYIILTAVLEELEENSTKPLEDLLNWSPVNLSSLVLLLLDKLISSINQQNRSSYFFKSSNLIVNPGHLSEDDYIIEANNIKLYMFKLYDESFRSQSGNEEFKKMLAAQESEIMLLYKWNELIENMLPPYGLKERRICLVGSRNRRNIAHSQYTVRQLEYLGLLLKTMLKVKQSIIQVDFDLIKQSSKNESTESEQKLEDVIYIIVTIMEQAKTEFLNNNGQPTQLKNKSKIKSQFNQFTTKLIEHIRKDEELKKLNLNDDLNMVKIILKWLYKSMDSNKKYITPIMKPYLNKLFISSYSVSWHLEAIKKKNDERELKAFGCFCKLVNSGQISPAQGLVDGANKNWNWAKEMLSMLEKHTLKIVFIPDRGQIYRHILSLPSYATNKNQVDSKEEIKRNTLPTRSYFNTLIKSADLRNEDKTLPIHDILRKNSSLTLIVDQFNRKGSHRGCGDIFKSLISMQKLNIFNEVTSHLPEENQAELTETISNLQNSKTKRMKQRWSQTLPHPRRKSSSGKYTPMGEASVCNLTLEKNHKTKVGTTLIESTRAARIREDNNVTPFENNLKIKALLRKSESFKY